ncbi:hypothetical protein ACLMJK_002817 [Lecanora helva]
MPITPDRWRQPLVILVVPVFCILIAILLRKATSPLAPPRLNGPSSFVINARTEVSYLGTSANCVDHFQNIFYAQDTSGSNRFSPPVPLTPPRGTVVDATTAGAWCPQGMGDAPLPWTSPVTNVSENCLSLRIARPFGVDSSSKLPVLVWLHGGGHALGSASDQFYQPDGLVRQSKSNGQPVIYVGINYRLGSKQSPFYKPFSLENNKLTVFGFATNKALRDAKQANNGIRDQRVAFESFGGDPKNVIAVGQSVGASSIALHLVSYSGKQGVPFQKAMQG